MKDLINSKLKEIEHQYGVRILPAVNQAAEHEDLNRRIVIMTVRFIYARKCSDYLKPEGIRDVIELPID